MCSHDPPYPELHATPSMEACAAMCTLVDEHGEFERHPRAVTVPEDNRTYVLRSFWQECGPLQRAAVIAHERAHVVIGLDCPCESCADKVGGFMMRVWGFSTKAVDDGFRSHHVAKERQPDGSFRVAPENATEGAAVAARALAARGFFGEVPSREELLKSKLTSTTAPSTKNTVGAALVPAKTASVDAASLELGARLAPASAELVPVASKTDVTATKTAIGAPISSTRAIGAAKPSLTTVKITDPSFTKPTAPVGVPKDPPASPEESEFKMAVMAQVVAGVVVALVVALVLGSR